MDDRSRTRSILDRLGDRIADAGRFLIQAILEREGAPEDWKERMEAVCDHILSGAGAASTLASVREIGVTYGALRRRGPACLPPSAQ